MTIYKNCNVASLGTIVSDIAFCVRDGRFFDIGDMDKISLIALPQEEVIDLQGHTVVPGFIDSHMHFLNYAVTKDQVAIAGSPSIEEIIKVTQRYIKERNIPENSWILSRGWNDNHFIEQRLPSRYDLDLISTKHPIFFARVCGHIGVMNSKALELLTIDGNTPDPVGGLIDKHQGEPTGVIRENALNIVFDALPKMSKEEIKRVLIAAFEDALKVGLTTIHTDDLGQAGSLETLLEAYKELEAENALPLRFSLQLHLPSVDKIKHASSLGLKSCVGSDTLKIAALKLYQDGSLGGRTALMEEKYEDKDTHGVAIYTQEQLDELVLTAHSHGFQIAIHAIGDKAMKMILNSYRKLPHEKNTDMRNMIIHCQFTNKELLEEFKKLKVIANVQPSFVMTDYPIVDKAVGLKRSIESYAWRDLLSMDIPVAFSSDAPIESFNPLWGIYAAVTRKDLHGNPEGGWHKDQKLTIAEALNAFTLGSAFMNFEEDTKGSISKGKLADFVVLSENIFSNSEDKIKDVKVLATYVGGIKKYSLTE